MRKQVNVALSRRFARLIHDEPLLSMDPVERGRLASLVERADSFEDLPEHYRELVRQAEANFERLLAEECATQAATGTSE